MNFTFHNPTKVIFGKGKIADLPKELDKKLNILLLFGSGSIKKNGVYDQVIKALAGYKLKEFWGIPPNPTYEKCMEAIDLCKKEKIDFILSVGGGSVGDAAKFIAAGVYIEKEDPWKLLSDWIEVKKALPIGIVLTLPATGTESNGNAVISRASTQDKLYFGSPKTFPVFTILDPDTTVTLDERQVSNGIVDAFTHVMEQYCTYPVDANLQDRMSEGILLTLIEKGPITLKDPKNFNARANFMYCCTMALNTWIGSGVPQDWATHMIGHEITALHGLDHGQTLAIVLPSLLNHQKKGKWDKLLQFAERVWKIHEGTDEQKVNLAIKKTKEFFESLGVKTKLSDYKIPKSICTDLPTKMLNRNKVIKLGERQDIHFDDVKKILEDCF